MFQPNFVTFTSLEPFSTHPLGGQFKGNQNDGFNFVLFADGSGGITKQMKDWHGNKTGRLYPAQLLATQEYLSAVVGGAINAPIRDCHFVDTDAHTVIMPFIEGKTGEELGIEDYYPNNHQGENLRLFDYLVANADRRPKNLIYTDDGRIVGIDHALCNFRPRTPSPELVAQLWNNGLTLEALLIIRPKLVNLWSDFAEVGFTTQHQNMIDNLDKLIKAFQILSQYAVIDKAVPVEKKKPKWLSLLDREKKAQSEGDEDKASRLHYEVISALYDEQTVTKGDVVGHEFHGNQWVQGMPSGCSWGKADNLSFVGSREINNQHELIYQTSQGNRVFFPWSSDLDNDQSAWKPNDDRANYLAQSLDRLNSSGGISIRFLTPNDLVNGGDGVASYSRDLASVENDRPLPYGKFVIDIADKNSYLSGERNDIAMSTGGATPDDFASTSGVREYDINHWSVGNISTTPQEVAQNLMAHEMGHYEFDRDVNITYSDKDGFQYSPDNIYRLVPVLAGMAQEALTGHQERGTLSDLEDEVGGVKAYQDMATEQYWNNRFAETQKTESVYFGDGVWSYSNGFNAREQAMLRDAGMSGYGSKNPAEFIAETYAMTTNPKIANSPTAPPVIGLMKDNFARWDKAPRVSLSKSTVAKGDIAGHPFHGNQYVGGIGGNEVPKVLYHGSPADPTKLTSLGIKGSKSRMGGSKGNGIKYVSMTDNPFLARSFGKNVMTIDTTGMKFLDLKNAFTISRDEPTWAGELQALKNLDLPDYAYRAIVQAKMNGGEIAFGDKDLRSALKADGYNGVVFDSGDARGTTYSQGAKEYRIFSDVKPEQVTGTQEVSWGVQKGDYAGHEFHGNQWTVSMPGGYTYRPERGSAPNATANPDGTYTWHQDHKDLVREALAQLKGSPVGLGYGLRDEPATSPQTAKAKALYASVLYELQHNATDTPKLYRGSQSDDNFTRPFDEWSERRSIASTFAKKYGGEVQSLSSGSKGIRIADYLGEGGGYLGAEKGWLVAQTPVAKGDYLGHDFHGNQHTGGIGGNGKVAEIQGRLASAAEKLTKKAFATEAEYPERMGARLTVLAVHGYNSLEEYQTASAQAIKDFVAKGDITVSVVTPEKNLLAILESGEVQNGYVSGKSERDYATKLGKPSDPRMKIENEAFGLTKDSPLSERPIYGFVDQPGLSDDPSLYGEAKIVLNPDIKERSTVTIGDSLDVATNVGWTAKFADTTAPLLASDPNPKDIFYPSQIQNIPPHLELNPPFARYKDIPYMEAQVHGGIKLNDIARVDFYGQPTPEVETALKEKGIPYNVKVTKGESAGHDFHGNQYTGGRGGTATLERPSDKFTFEQKQRILSQWSSTYRHRDFSEFLDRGKPYWHNEHDLWSVELFARNTGGHVTPANFPLVSHSIPDPKAEPLQEQCDRAIANADEFMGLVSDIAKPYHDDIIRGIHDPDHTIASKFTEGSTVDLPLSSWANVYHEQMVQNFAENSWNNDDPRNPQSALILHAPKGTVGADLVGFTSSAQFLTGGRFSVDKVEIRDNGSTHVYLTQQQFYAKSKDWKKTNPNYLPNWFPQNFKPNLFVAKALQKSPESIQKGEGAGHPFRGNQYTQGISGGNEELAKGASAYAKLHGIVRPDIDYSRVQVNPERALAIANEYVSLPSVDESARPAYRQFVQETHQQFEYLTKVLGIKIDVVKDDPYPTSKEMAQDLLDNHHLSVLSADSTGGHPFVSNREIEEFRAVHDAFGHGATGRDFDRNGEEGAWASHSSMYTPLARLAMTTATRGQNSVMTQVGGGFPEQKGALLSAQWSDPSTISYGDSVSKSLDGIRPCFGGGRAQYDHQQQSVVKGDVAGHAFHGNQWTGGIGGNFKGSDFPSGHVPKVYTHGKDGTVFEGGRPVFSEVHQKELFKMLEGAKGVIRMSPSALKRVIDQDEIQNVFQSQKSGAVMWSRGAKDYYTQRRIDMEEGQLGVPKDASPEQRPVYGYITGDNVPLSHNEPEFYSPNGDPIEIIGKFYSFIEDDPELEAREIDPNDVVASPQNYSIINSKYIDYNGYPQSNYAIFKNSELETRLEQMYNRRWATQDTRASDALFRNAKVYPCDNEDGSLNTNVIAGLATNQLGISGYGTTQVILKDSSALQNTTMTIGDSLLDWVAPAIPTEMAVANDPNTPVFSMWTQTEKVNEPPVVHDYIELQIYNHPTNKDIELVRFTGDAPAPALLKSLDKAGVPYDTSNAPTVPLKSYAVKVSDWYAKRKVA